MNYNVYLIEVLRDQFEDYLIDEYGFSEDEVEELYKDNNGVYYESDGDFIRAYRKDLFSNVVMESIYNFITKISLISEEYANGLISLLFTHFYVKHYQDPDKRPYLKTIADANIDVVVKMFYEYENFGVDLLASYYQDFIEPEEYAKKQKIITDKYSNNVLNHYLQIAYPEKVYTLNQKLREIICNLYNHYISMGYTDAEALEITWCYFFNDVDPLNELEEIGITGEQRNMYKSYMLGLIIGDLYEDATNTPLVKTDNFDGKIAQVLPIIYAAFGTIDIPEEKGIRGRMLKYFILLQDDKEKIRSNRQNTLAQKREKVLKKVNPFYILDEI
ncbi:MAG: hypothetical protein IKR74_01685 [Bacilli bacterium]|nr:hypothetical protein [Bacilli bacterium]